VGRGFFRALLWLVGIGGAIGVLLHLFVFDYWVVPGTDPMFVASIRPNLFPEDKILVRRDSSGDLRAGKLARCTSPNPGADYVIGRVMGLPGDTLEVKEEKVYVNGVPAVESRHGCKPVTMVHPLNGMELTLACRVEDNGAFTYAHLYSTQVPEGARRAVVEPGKLFLVSDNRHLHQDSRDYGLVDATTCEHVVFRLWGESFVDASRRFTVLY